MSLIYLLYIHYREEDALEYLSRSVLCLHHQSPHEMLTDPSQTDHPFLLDSKVVLNSGRRADGRGASGAEVSDYEHCV